MHALRKDSGLLPVDRLRCAAVPLTGAHGAAGVESSGLLRTDKWNTTAEQLVDTLLSAVVH
jgi:hypothetical protein